MGISRRRAWVVSGSRWVVVVAGDVGGDVGELLPVVDLVVEVAVLGGGGELVGPGLEAGGAGAEVEGFAGAGLFVAGGQVLDEDSPGHAVDDEVVGDEEQLVWAVAGEQCDAGDWAVGEAEAGLEVVDAVVAGGGGGVLVKAGQIDGLDR